MRWRHSFLFPHSLLHFLNPLFSLPFSPILEFPRPNSPTNRVCLLIITCGKSCLVLFYLEPQFPLMVASVAQQLALSTWQCSYFDPSSCFGRAHRVWPFLNSDGYQSSCSVFSIDNLDYIVNSDYCSSIPQQNIDQLWCSNTKTQEVIILDITDTQTTGVIKVHV